MEAPPDWDLLAVVRSCCTTTSATTSAVASGQDLLPFPQQLPQEPCFSPSSVSSSTNALFQFHNPFDSPTTSFITSTQDLQDICKPMICTTTSTTITTTINNTACSSVAVNNSGFQQSVCSSPVSPSSSFRSFGVATEQPPQLRRLIKPTQVVFGAPNSTTTPVSSSQGQRTKKRKNLMKKVCHVPAEGLSSDMWAWRKYGQKPIKGSPYPRGYYRCSSSKGCLARKQVERNRSDPKMFIVTYTAEHNHPMPTHRNSLAGSTRQKPLSGQQTTVSGDTTTTTTPPENPTCSSPSGNSLSPLTEKSESKTECEDTIKDENGEDNEMGISDLILNDDFYVGFEQIDGDDGSDSFSDHFSPSMEFPWLVNSSGTVTAAGGS